jgi:hypothetical protein
MKYEAAPSLSDTPVRNRRRIIALITLAERITERDATDEEIEAAVTNYNTTIEDLTLPRTQAEYWQIEPTDRAHDEITDEVGELTIEACRIHEEDGDAFIKEVEHLE